MKSKLIIFFILLGLHAYSIDSITHVFGTNESTICRSLDTINCVIFGYLENQQNLDYVDKGELEILNKDFDNKNKSDKIRNELKQFLIKKNNNH